MMTGEVYEKYEKSGVDSSDYDELSSVYATTLDEALQLENH
jgi:hypothetical protein